MEMLVIILVGILWVLLSRPWSAALERRLEPAVVRVHPVTNRPRSLRRLRVSYGG